MPLNRTAPRLDLPYLRRHPKRDESVPETATTRAAAAPSLSLTPPAATAPAPARPASPAQAAHPTRQRSRPVARVTGRTILTNESRVVTLNRRQSAIGSLVIDTRPSGTVSCIWELVDGTAGIVSETTGIEASPEFGKRALVQLRRGQLIVGLRHVHQLRRLLLVVPGPVPADRPLTVVLSLHDGFTIESAHAGPAPATVAVAAYQMGGELVVRREDRGLSALSEAAGAFGFAATWTPPPAPGLG